MTHEASSVGYYVKIFLALMVLTATTVVVTFFDLGRLNLVVALLIAMTKATLVVLFFMHVKQSSALTKVFIVSGIFWFVVLLVLTGSDYIGRTMLPNPQAW